ncbi:MAG: 16S rRNA (adenine(1518)-N(6)/adenine(1519)-N(6))-dimethyltransferase RsmA [bacterium]|nr:16S rRNA (adenine(1518)-N(6)/adenine(1519)-N(6))-dimethyltransferase RsmA [bacterium]
MKKKLSQHFLFEKNILNKIIDLSGLTRGESVIEIGAGMGTLTEFLIIDAGRVCAFEIDSRLADILKERFIRHENLEILNRNFLNYDLRKLKKTEDEKFRIISNIPYAITTDILVKIIEFKDMISSATLTVQKEYGLRLIGQPGTKAYSALTVFVNSCANVELLFNISASSFSPPPKVDSVVVKIDWKPEIITKEINTKEFSLFVKLLFSQRRKQIRNSIKNIYHDLNDEQVSIALKQVGIASESRPEVLTLEEFLELFKIIRKDVKTS